MSKSVSIKEGNTAKSFSGVKKISIKNIGGNSSSLWVPEDEVKLGTKHISENGTYKASEEVDEQGVSKNLYGYSEVTVSGIGVASGTNPETGEDSIIDKDSFPNMNDVPSSIAFSEPPSKLEYVEGEEISLSGASVHAYMKANGGTEPWAGDETHPSGLIPLEELTLDPTTAHAESQSEDWTDGDGLNALRISYTKIEDSNTWYCYDGKLGTYHHYDASVGGRGEAELFVTRYNNKVYASRISGNGLFYLFAKNDNGKWIFSGSTTYSPQIGEFTIGDWENYLIDIPESTKDPTQTDPADLKPMMQEIKVSWNRVGDGKELSTILRIIVIYNQEQEEDDFEGGGAGTVF